MPTKVSNGVDFLVSYDTCDDAWAQWVAWQLENAGYKVIVQSWDFVVGSNFLVGMQEGVVRANKTLALLSNEYLKSKFSSAEWLAAFGSDPLGHDRKLIVARLEECARPGLLSGIISFDLFNLNRDEARDVLLRNVSSAIVGRAKPEKQPAFPGSAADHTTSPHFPGLAPRAWSTPPRNPHFTGRVDALDALTTGLIETGSVTIASLRGMGGVGKSQLAIEYSHAHASEYDVVWFISAADAVQLAQGMRHLIVGLGAPDPGMDQEEIRRSAFKHLADVPSWLIILDNAESAELAREWLPGATNNSSSRRHALITTRRGGFGSIGVVVGIDTWDSSEAVAFLRKRLTIISDDIARALAHELGYLPLALEQAAAYVEVTGMDAGEYLGLLRTRRSEMLTRGRVLNTDLTMATIWDIHISQISQTCESAIQLLDLCAYFAGAPIPLMLFTNSAGWLYEPLATAAGDNVDFADVVGTLVDYALAKRGKGTIQLHTLTQAAIRSKHESSRGSESLSEYLPPALELLRSACPTTRLGGTDDWGSWSDLLPHVLATTALYGLEKECDEFTSTTCSSLLGDAATYLQTLGNAELAATIMERAQLIDQQLGTNQRVIAKRLNDRALALKETGRASEARPLAEKAVELMRLEFGNYDLDLANDLASLAAIQDDLHEYNSALANGFEALKISKHGLGPRHRSIVRRLNNLGLVFLHMNDPKSAQGLISESLEIARETVGEGHHLFAATLGNLAAVHGRLGESEIARKELVHALAISDRVLPPGNFQIRTQLDLLHDILTSLGEAAAAEAVQARLDATFPKTENQGNKLA